MVQAIIEGRKTMTRRVMKPQPYPVTSHGASVENYFEWDASKKATDLPIQEWTALCPYGKVGDILWVREKTCYVMLEHAHDLLEGFKEKRQIIYGTDFHEDWMDYAKEKYSYQWKPSLFMPKSACRIFLEITDIRVERLQDISGVDAVKEGFGLLPENGISQQSFFNLWEILNGKQSLYANPWVWVVSFKRIEKPVNF